LRIGSTYLPRHNVDTLTHCVHCRWQAIYDSKVVEVAGDLTPEAVGIDTLLAVAAFADLLQKGVTLRKSSHAGAMSRA